MQIQAIPAELTVEALDDGVLSRLAWLDEVELYAGLHRPEEHRLTGQLGAVVANNRIG